MNSRLPLGTVVTGYNLITLDFPPRAISTSLRSPGHDVLSFRKEALNGRNRRRGGLLRVKYGDSEVGSQPEGDPSRFL